MDFLGQKIKRWRKDPEDKILFVKWRQEFTSEWNVVDFINIVNFTLIYGKFKNYNFWFFTLKLNRISWLLHILKLQILWKIETKLKTKFSLLSNCSNKQINSASVKLTGGADSYTAVNYSRSYWPRCATRDEHSSVQEPDRTPVSCSWSRTNCCTIWFILGMFRSPAWINGSRIEFGVSHLNSRPEQERIWILKNRTLLISLMYNWLMAL